MFSDNLGSFRGCVFISVDLPESGWTLVICVLLVMGIISSNLLQLPFLVRFCRISERLERAHCFIVADAMLLSWTLESDT